MLTLLIASAFIIDCNCVLECPDGTSQVGDVGAMGTTQCGQPGQLGLSTIEDCRDYVENIPPTSVCTLFSFDTNYKAVGDVAGTSLCFPYRVTLGQYADGNPRSDQIICELAIQNCPSDTTQIGPAQQSGAEPCDILKHFDTIEECKNYCDISTDCNSGGNTCQSFSYAVGYRRCFPYHTQDPGSVNGAPGQILCGVEEGDTPECPENTKQIGTTGTYFVASALAYGHGKTIAECRDDCLDYYDRSRGACTAIAFDNDYTIDDASPSFCMLYSVNSKTQTIQLTSGYRVDQILCRLLDIFPEGSSVAGLLNFDGLDVIDNGNDKFMQISSYVVYGIGGLVFVNVVCLLVHCWNKRKNNNKKYKVVSMRSDIDEEMVN